MSGIAEKADPKLWEKVKKEVTEGDRGGKPGQWSARKAQLATAEYKSEGGGYKGKKTADNHLDQWTHDDWGTKSGEKSEDTGERYLPKEAREHLTPSEYKRTSDKKRADTKTGRQFSTQPNDVARKTKLYRSTGADTPSKAELYAKAKAQNITGRSKMDLAALKRAVS